MPFKTTVPIRGSFAKLCSTMLALQLKYQDKYVYRGACTLLMDDGRYCRMEVCYLYHGKDARYSNLPDKIEGSKVTKETSHYPVTCDSSESGNPQKNTKLCQVADLRVHILTFNLHVTQSPKQPQIVLPNTRNECFRRPIFEAIFYWLESYPQGFGFESKSHSRSFGLCYSYLCKALITPMNRS